MPFDILLVVAGIALLSYAADKFVGGAARLSTLLRVSPVVIGAVVIGFGTSAPELLVSVLATLRGDQDIAYGNIVGSNTTNILLVLGTAALVRPAVVAVRTLQREVPVALAAVALLWFVLFDGRATLVDGVVLLAGGAAAIAVVILGALRDRAGLERMRQEVEEFEGEVTGGPGRAAVVALLGLVGVLAGAEALVRGATGLAEAVGVSQAVIGLTVVAIGTSLPELVTAVVAARRDESDLVVGNILGSNIFNSLLVGGTAGVLDTVDLDQAFGSNLVMMGAAMLLGSVFLLTGRRLGRGEGTVLLVGFVAWLAATGLGLGDGGAG